MTLIGRWDRPRSLSPVTARIVPKEFPNRNPIRQTVRKRCKKKKRSLGENVSEGENCSHGGNNSDDADRAQITDTRKLRGSLLYSTIRRGTLSKQRFKTPLTLIRSFVLMRPTSLLRLALLLSTLRLSTRVMRC